MASFPSGRYSSPLTQAFAWFGHAFMHLLVALYLTIVLALEKEWGLGYDELIGLWTVGAFMVGAGAPLAGWLGDRWSMMGMLVVFFVGSGVSAVAAGLADGPTTLLAALAALGLFASIFHPIGMSALVRTARRRGITLGIFGVFGSAGVAAAGITAAALIDFIDWRAAFIVPGAVAILAGLLLWLCLATGAVVDRSEDAAPHPAASRADMVRAFFVLTVTVACSGLIYQATQVAMPKLFAEGLGALAGEGTVRVGAFFTLVYVAAGLCQLVGGWLADRFPLRAVYMISYILQIPLLFLVAGLTGLPLLTVTIAMVVLNAGALPAENCLLSRFTPDRWRGTAFGAKFVLSLGVTPVAVQLVAWIFGATGGFEWLFVLLGALAVVVVGSCLLLPGDRPDTAPAPAE